MAIANAVDAGTAGFQSLTSGGVWNGRTLTPGAGISITNGDGTGGNPVISATGGGGGQPATLDFWDDFIYNINTLGSGDSNWNITGLLTSTAESGRPGIITISMTGGGTIIKNTPAILLGAGEVSITWFIRLSGGASYTILAGLAAATSVTDFADGVYFYGNNATNSGNWVGKTANASSRSSANSSVAVGTGWHVLQVRVNAAATSVSFYQGTTYAGLTQIANSPLAADIPTAALSPCFCGVGSAGETLMADLVLLNYALTTAR